MKVLKDTLTVNGKYSQKRLMTFSSFFTALVYAFLPAFITFDVKEFVFLGFLGAGGFSLFRTQKVNENINTNDTENIVSELINVPAAAASPVKILPIPRAFVKYKLLPSGTSFVLAINPFVI